MGWFSNLFSKKKNLSEVQNWIKEQQQELDKQHEGIVKTLEQEFPSLIENAKEAVSKLANSELMNPDIPERAKHFMQGNREQLVKATTRLIEQLLVPKTAGDITFIDQQFSQYTQTNARAATILSEFFGQEVKEIRNALAGIEQKMNELRAHEQKKQAITEMQSHITAIEETARQNEEQKQKQQEMENKIKELKEKQEALKKDKEGLVSSKDYTKIKEELLAANRKRQQAEQVVTDFFQPLSDAIKKYAHAIHDKSLEEYAEKPLQTLIHDYSLKIVAHAHKIKEMLEKGELELKPEKIEKAKENIALLTKTHLATIVHDYANAKKQETDLQKSITTRPVLQKLEQVIAELKATEKDLLAMEEETGKLSPISDTGERNALSELLKPHKIVLI